MCTPGGEVTFISRIIDQSTVVRDRVRWYSSMVGKLSSIQVLVEKLRGLNVSLYLLSLSLSLLSISSLSHTLLLLCFLPFVLRRVLGFGFGLFGLVFGLVFQRFDSLFRLLILFSTV